MSVSSPSQIFPSAAAPVYQAPALESQQMERATSHISNAASSVAKEVLFVGTGCGMCALFGGAIGAFATVAKPLGCYIGAPLIGAGCVSLAVLSYCFGSKPGLSDSQPPYA